MEHMTSMPRLEGAVAQALNHWRVQSEKAAAEAAPSPTAYTIAISRQAGTSGPAIAREVGQRLGWPVYDRELVELIAQEMGLRSRLVESVDERRRNWLQEWWQEFTTRPELPQSEYAENLVHVLLSLASHGECVIVGRGAAQVLPEATTLRVRLVGPEAGRVAMLQEKFDLSADEARRWVRQTDERRGRFVRDTFHKNPDDLTGYDLVLNTCRLGVKDCADMIVNALQRMKAARPVVAVPAAQPAPSAG